jgi:hypothetical protein
MKPEEMTSVELLDIMLFAAGDPGFNYDENRTAYHVLLHRLNEADTLRKENEELRKDKARLDYFDRLPKGMAFVIAADLDGVTYIIADNSQPVRKSIDNALVGSTVTTL